jgi:uncharacterized protein
VADASFLIGLSLIEPWALLATLVERVYVASAVWTEVVEQGQDRPGAGQLQRATWVTHQAVCNRRAVEMLQVFLGAGEAETLVLAEEVACPLVFMDDLKGRKAAQAAGFQTMGVVGVLLVGKQMGRIRTLHPLLTQLQRQGFRLSRALVDMALRAAGEFPTSTGEG